MVSDGYIYATTVCTCIYILYIIYTVVWFHFIHKSVYIYFLVRKSHEMNKQVTYDIHVHVYTSHYKNYTLFHKHNVNVHYTMLFCMKYIVHHFIFVCHI